MAGIPTTAAAVVLAVRTHTNADGPPNMATANERLIISAAVIESARLFAGGSLEAARGVHDQLAALSDEQWWAHAFVLHPNCQKFVHHLL